MKFLNKLKFVKSKFLASLILATTLLFSNNIFASKESLQAIYYSYEETVTQNITQLTGQVKRHLESFNDLDRIIKEKSQLEKTIEEQNQSMIADAKKGYIPNLEQRQDEIEKFKKQIVAKENLIQEKCHVISPSNPAAALFLIPENYSVLEGTTKETIDEFNPILQTQAKINQLKSDFIKVKTAYLLASSIETEQAVEQEVLNKDIPIDLNILSKTYTPFGALHLAEMLANPSQNIEEQEIIRKLVENPQLFEQTEKLLSMLKFTINNYLQYYYSLAIESQNLPQVIQQMNTVLQSNNKLKYYLLSPAWNATKQTAIQTLLFGLPLVLLLSETPGDILTLDPYINATTNYKVWAATALSQLAIGIAGKFKNPLLKHGIPTVSMFSIPSIMGNTNISNFTFTTAPVRGFCSFLSKIKESWNRKNQVIADINPIVKNTKLLIQCLEKLEQTTDLKPLTIEIKSLLDKKDKQPDELSNLLKLCDGNEDNTKVTFITMLQALVNMPNPENKAVFINALKSVGKIDALMTLTKFQKEHDLIA